MKNLLEIRAEDIETVLIAENRGDLVDPDILSEMVRKIRDLASKKEVSSLPSLVNLVRGQIENVDRKRLKEEQVRELKELLDIAKKSYQKLVPGGDFYFIGPGQLDEIEPILIGLHRFLGNTGYNTLKRAGASNREQSMITRLRSLVRELEDLGKHFDIDHKPNGLVGTPCVVLWEKSRIPNIYCYTVSTILSIGKKATVQIKGVKGSYHTQSVFPDLRSAQAAYPGYQFILDESLIKKGKE